MAKRKSVSKKQPKENLSSTAIKSVQEYINSSVGYLPTNTPTTPAFNSDLAIKNFKSWVYVAANKNASAMASVPLRLYVRKKEGQKCLYPTKRMSLKKKQYLSGDARTRPSNYVLKKLNTGSNNEFEEIVVEHPILSLLSTVNPYFNGFDMQYLKFLFLELVGNAYWYLENNGYGVPDSMWILPSQSVSIIPGTDTELVAGYEYGTSKKVIFSPQEVIQFKYPNPSSLYYGLGKVEAGWGVVNINSQNHTYRENLLKNSARPDYAVIFKDLETTNAGMNRYEQFLNNKLSGPNKAGRFLTMPANVELKPLNFTPKEMGQGDDKIIEEISGIFGTPKSVLLQTADLSETILSNWYRTTITPALILDEQKLNEQLLPLYPDSEDLILAYDEPSIENKQLETQKIDLYLQRGVLTINEVRRMEGIEEEIEEYGDLPLPVLNSYVQSKFSLGTTGLSLVPESETEDTTEVPEDDTELQSEESDIQDEGESKILTTGCKCCGKPEKKEQTIILPAKKIEALKEVVKEQVDKKDSDKKSLTTEIIIEEVSANNAQVEKSRFAKFCEKYVDVTDHPENSFMLSMIHGIKSVFKKQKEACVEYTYKITGQKSYAGDLDELLNSFNDDFKKQLKPVLEEIFKLAGSEALQEIGFAGVFDVYNPLVSKAIDKYILKLAGVVNDTTLLQIKNLLKEGLEKGNTVAEIADSISNATSFSDARCMMISRTESAQAYFSGEIEAAKQSGVVEKRKWLSSVDGCPECMALNGKEVGLDEEFGDWFNHFPHPSCRCSQTFLVQG